MKNLLITILALFNFALVSATDYFVSSAGNDSNNGKTATAAWKSISKVNATSFLPGDRILFNKGDTWRETLTVRSSGSSGSNIVFGSYGTGNLPKILGSAEVTSWTKSSGNIWYSNNSVTDPYSLDWDGNIYFKETNGDISWGRVKKSSTGSLTQDYDWTWSSNRVYIYSSSDPHQKYAGVEVSQRLSCINLNDKSYLTFDGLEIAYPGSTGVGELYSNTNTTDLIIRNCHIHHIGIKASSGAYGLSVYHSNMLIQNNIIHDSGRRNVSLNIYDRQLTVNNIIVEDNTLYHGFHTTGVDIAITGSGTMNNITLRRNLIYDDVTESLDGVESYSSTMVYTAVTSNGSIDNLHIYYNIIKNITNSGLAITGVTNAYIHNNLIYGVNPNLSTGSSVILNVKNAIFRNNIIYANTTRTGYRGLQKLGGTISSDYNLFYSTNASSIMVQWGSGYTMSSFASYKSSTGQDAHSPNPSNPLFASASDYRLQAGSPAIGKGLTVTGLTTDFAGNSVKTPPSIGPYESGSAAAPPPAAAIPVMQTSVVENATPSVLQLAYDISLDASKVPAVASYTVLVNGSARALSSIAIVGSKVQLTLSSAIKFGDVVLASYTKPATNPLQTVAGGIAANFSSKAVTNNLASITKDVPPVTVSMTIPSYYIHTTMNITFKYSSVPTTEQLTLMTPQVIKITDSQGRLYVEKLLVTGLAGIKLPINLRRGYYNIILLTNGIQSASKRAYIW